MRTFDGLEVFAAVVDAGSFTRAAARLKLTKSTVSESVRALEQRLGVRLLDRTTRSLRPTQAGRVVHARAMRAIGEAHAAADEAQQHQTQATGLLRVAVPEGFARLHMVPSLPVFLDRNPALRVELIESVQYVDLIDSGVDLAVRISTSLDPRTITRRIGHSRVIIVASPGYLAAHGRPRRPADVRRHRCVGFSPRHWGHEWHFLVGGDTLKIPIEAVMLADSSESVRAAAVAGIGLVALPHWLVTDLLASGTITRVLDEYETPESGIYAVYPTARLIPAKVKRFVEHTAQVLKSKGL